MPTAHTPLQRDIMLGVLARLAAVFCVACVSAGAKWMAAGGAPLLQIIFCRSFFAFIPILLHIRSTVGFGALKTQRPWRHLTRSAVGLMGMSGSFLSVAYLPLVQAVTLAFSAPLFMTILSVVLLKERVGWHRWLAVFVGFAGVVIAMRPGDMHGSPLGVFFGLMGAMGAASAMTSIRSMPRSESGPTIVFYFTLSCSVVGLASAPFGWITPGPQMLVVMVGTGLIGGIAQLLLTAAARLAPLPILAPFDYTQLIWATGLGYFVWGEQLDGWIIAGAAVIAASGVYIVWREKLVRGL